MGKKIYNFVLRKDWIELAKKLRGPLPNMDNPNIKEPQCDPDDIICEPDPDGTPCFKVTFVHTMFVCASNTFASIPTLVPYWNLLSQNFILLFETTCSFLMSPFCLFHFPELLAPILQNASWNETVEFSVRMQCNLIRRSNPSKSTGFQVK